MKITSPLSVLLPRKTIADKKMYLNLNCFKRNCFIVNNQIKHALCDALQEQLEGLKLKPPIRLHYRIFYGSNRKSDRANAIAIIAKNFCDALTYFNCIPDDNDDYILGSSEDTGGVDKKNPRCEITITESAN